MTSDNDTNASFLQFVKVGAMDHVASMLKQCRDYCHVEDEDGIGALHLACLRGLNDMAKLLISCGADPALASPRGWTALHYASIWGHVDVLNTLIDTGRVDVGATNSQGETALAICCLMGHQEAVSVLLHRGLTNAASPLRTSRGSLAAKYTSQELRQCKRKLAKARSVQDKAAYATLLMDYKAIKATLDNFDRVQVLRESREDGALGKGHTVLHCVSRDLYDDAFEGIMQYVFSM